MYTVAERYNLPEIPQEPAVLARWMEGPKFRAAHARSIFDDTSHLLLNSRKDADLMGRKVLWRKTAADRLPLLFNGSLQRCRSTFEPSTRSSQRRRLNMRFGYIHWGQIHTLATRWAACSRHYFSNAQIVQFFPPFDYQVYLASEESAAEIGAYVCIVLGTQRSTRLTSTNSPPHPWSLRKS
ncbi:hypothetical protein EV401DRAFT_1897240 [Pisolithus croceorrhizus]|nr:hypothetical protein EV401DRAFT_1897240 [Pisolithus croceorrhizus]